MEAQKLAFEKQKWEAQLRKEEAQLRMRRLIEKREGLRERTNYEKKRLREKINCVERRING